MARLAGKVAVVTGGAGGVGSATAKLFTKEGAKVTIADVAVKQGEAVAMEIGCDFLPLDVTSEQQWSEIVSAVVRKHNGINILINSAGTEGTALGDAGSPEATTLEEWRRVHSINLEGTFLGCRTVLPVMKRSGIGSIVNVSSMISFYGSPGLTSYGSSKAGVQQLTKSVALYGSRDNNRIRCNSVHPGVIRTRMLEKVYAELGRSMGMTPGEVEESSLRGIPFGVVGDPDDVGYLILYLASDEAKYVTGSEFQVDGGQHLIDAK